MGAIQTVHDGWDHVDIVKDGYSHKLGYHNGKIVWAKDFFSFKTLDSMIRYDTGEVYVAGVVWLNFKDIVLIDWGDGTETHKTSTGTVSHTYPTSDLTEYTVKIYGQITKYHGYMLLDSIYCSSITEILTPLQQTMRINSDEYDLRGMFSLCPTLKKIPIDLFENFKGVSGVLANGMFSQSGLEEVPVGLFDGMVGAHIDNIFVGCNSLETVPSGVFTSGSCYAFSSPFLECKNLKYVYDYPAGTSPAFDGCDSLEIIGCSFVGVTSFESAFEGMTSLKTLTSNVFVLCTDATSFKRCFYGCTSLEDIPSGLFDGLEKVETFDYCFYNCKGIKSLPENLFSSAFVCTSFQYCFGACSSLEDIPVGLFDNCFEVTTYFGTFLQCTSVQSVPSDLFDDSTKVTVFRNTFFNCSGITSAVPELWNRSGISDEDGCYYNCVNASNYDSIPDSWKER